MARIAQALHLLPTQGERVPWSLLQHHLPDLALLHCGKLEDDELMLSNLRKEPQAGSAQP
ncbi:hypothetical protein OMD46_03065 [Pseudomonas sp. MDMC_285]|nr:hypothetical protein [Pseudomonas sp. MDMC_285]